MADLTKYPMSKEHKIEKLIEMIQDTFVKVPSASKQLEIYQKDYDKLRSSGKLTSFLASAGFDPSRSYGIARYNEAKGTIILEQQSGYSDQNGPGKNPNYFLFSSMKEAENFCRLRDIDPINLIVKEFRTYLDFQELQVSRIPDIALHIIGKLRDNNFQFGEKLNISYREGIYRIDFAFRQFYLEKKVAEKRRMPNLDWTASDIEKYNKFPAEPFKKSFELDADLIKKAAEFIEKLIKLEEKRDTKWIDEKGNEYYEQEDNKPKELPAPAPTPSRLEFFDADKVDELIGD